jgi:hypothetical protein
MQINISTTWFDHGFRGADFGLPNGARRFDIDDNRRLQIYEIIVGIGKESMSLERSRPLRSGIGARDELRFDLAAAPHAALSLKATTNHYRILDVRRLAREGLLKPGYLCGWKWMRNGETVASIQMQAEQDRVILITGAAAATRNGGTSTMPCASCARRAT